MISMDIPIDVALNVGTPGSASAGPAASKTAASSQGMPGRAVASNSRVSSFRDELRSVNDQFRNAEADQPQAAPVADPRTEGSDPSQSVAAQTTEAQKPPADDPQGPPARNQEVADTWTYLLQTLQSIAAALPSAASGSEKDADATGVEPAEDDAAKALSQLLDILKQLRDAPQDLAQEGMGAERISDVLHQLQDVMATTQPGELPGQTYQVLQELSEELSGLAWGRMMKEIATHEPAAAVEAEKSASTAAAMTQVRADALVAGQHHRETSLPSTVRPFRAEAGQAAQENQPAAAGNQPIFSDGPPAENAQMQAEEGGPVVRIPAASAAIPSQTGEGGRGLETFQPADAIADPSEISPEIRVGEGAEAGENRQSPDDPLTAKTLAGAEAGQQESAEPAEPFDMGTAGRHLLESHQAGIEKTSEPVGPGKDKETAGPNRAGVLDQIVQRAVLQVKADQSEMKIDLKPDFLGNVRMQIISENRQVSVRIFTELPVVRDMIETGLQQLRSELQNQGLHVDRLEVAVSDDRRQSPRRQAKPDDVQKAGGAGAVSSADRAVSNERIEPAYYRRRAGSTATIDMFI